MEGAEEWYWVREFVNGGSLKELLEVRGGCLPESQAKLVLRSIISGFNYLYQEKVIHRDCKMDNFLIHFHQRDPSHPFNLKDINLD